MPDRRPARCALLLAGALLGACGDSTPATDSGAGAALERQVCQASRAATAGRADEARRAFDDAHHDLHDLAASAEAVDRRAAAELLEAKQRVEAPAPTPAEYAGLAAAVGRALVATGELRADDVGCGDE